MSEMNIDRISDRTEAIIDKVCGAIMATVDVAAERLELAAEVARVKQRMTAFSAVLDAVAAQKQALMDKLEEADGPARQLLGHQIELLTAQETAVLQRAGISAEIARPAIDAADHGDEDGQLYKRDGRRFVPATNGSAN